MLFRTFRVAAMVVGCLPAASHAQEPAYVASWSDGTTMPADGPLMWIGKELRPELGKTSPLVGNNPLRRLRHAALVRQHYSGGRVELLGGDRVTGRVIEFLTAGTDGPGRPDCLVVEPVMAPDEPLTELPPRLRIPITRIRRVVWEERHPRPYRPNTLVYRDGRQIAFRSLRWLPGEVRLLVEQGTESIAWDDIAEVHLSERDGWEEYADQLAIIAPDAASKLIRIETPSGLRVTTSLERLRVTGDVAKPESQLFLVHPAWSLDRFTIPHRLVSSQTFFAPHEVPLSNLEPSGYAHRAALGEGWRQWRADADVQGDPLVCGEREFAWGFGVHGSSDLQFDLPPYARAFRTFVGLDRAAGDGGCVRARIYFGANLEVGGPLGRPLFETPPIIGSAKPIDSGRLELRPAGGRINRLILSSDALAFDHPPQTDPLDVRDVVDWCEPLVELDPAAVKAAVLKHAASLFVRETRWNVQGTYGEAWRFQTHAYADRSGLVIEALRRPLTVWRNVALPPDAATLVVYGGVPDDRGGTVKAKLLIGGQAQGEGVVATMTDLGRPPELRLPIPPTFRGRELRCDVVFQGTTEVLRVDVRALRIVAAN